MTVKTVLQLFILLLFFAACNNRFSHSSKQLEKENESGAGLAMDMWTLTRAFPQSSINNSQYFNAYERAQKTLYTREVLSLPTWKALGPKNIGGRTLALAFHPTNPNIIFVGSASGGLWKTTTAGVGANAWQRVEMGFPVLGVSSIAIASDGNTMYVGTGEVYGYQNVGQGFGIRLRRGSYGIGILKSTDGGATWKKTLDWAYSDLRGVQDIIINPKNANTVYAATTEGVYKTMDGGANWTNINPRLMAVDLEIHPTDTSKLYVTFGSLNNTDVGIYRTINAGTSWTKLTTGLPSVYTGKALIDISQSNPNILFASVADAENQIGLYKSTNGGDSWFTLNNNDIAQYQGWFAHDVGVHPSNPNHVFHVGIDAYCSGDGGASFGQVSYWYKWYFGRPAAGGPEGPDDYVHADIHGIAFSPHNPAHVWLYTDGGMFMSKDTGRTWEGRNGGYQSQQFYANFSNSNQDSLFAIGGMQDNSTAIYDGQGAWTRVIGGDGMCTAINPNDDNIVFGSYQYLSMLRSPDRGQNFYGVGRTQTGTPAFNGPFEIAPSNPDSMYAGAQRLMLSTDGGQSFYPTTSGFVDDGNQIITIAVAPNNAKLVYFSTIPNSTNNVKIYKSSDGGKTLTAMTGLPNRITTDIIYHPKNNNIVYATVSGFGGAHLYRTINGGQSWQAFGSGLPDVPTNTIVADPLNPEFMYVGNDLGVYFSRDTGNTWLPMNQGLPNATLAMHLSISNKNRKLRVATHGVGVYECDLLKQSDFLNKINYVRVVNQLETKPNSVNATYYLQSNPSNLTVVQKNGASAQLDLPGNIEIPTATPPQYPYPNGNLSTLNNALYPYKIAVNKTDGVANAGVTTYDISVISKHILGQQLINSPYKLLAADVDSSGDIDAADMLLIRQVVLRIEPNFKKVPNWIFVPKTFNLPALPKLSDVPQAYYFNAYSSNNPDTFRFVAIKAGDVNESATAFLSATERREAITLSVDNQWLEKDKIYDILIKMPETSSVLGIQGALLTEGASILDISSPILSDFSNNNFHILNKNQAVFSWNNDSDVPIMDNQTLFIVKIKADKSGELKNMLKLNQDILNGEIYAETDLKNGAPREIELKFNADFKQDKLYSAEPNPFNNETVVKFDVSTEGVVQFRLFDENGRVLFENQAFYTKGQHVLKLNDFKINIPSGVFILTMKTERQMLSTKLSKLR